MRINVSPLELERLRASGQVRLELVTTVDFKVSEIIVLVNHMDNNDDEPVRIIDVDTDERRTILTVEK